MTIDLVEHAFEGFVLDGRRRNEFELAIGSTSREVGDVARRFITASCSLLFFMSSSATNPSAADVSSLQMDSWKRRLRARRCRFSTGRK